MKIMMKGTKEIVAVYLERSTSYQNEENVHNMNLTLVIYL